MHRVILPHHKQLSNYIHSYNEFILNRLKLEDFEDMIIPDALADIWIIKGDDLLFSFDNKSFKSLPKKNVWGLFNKKLYLKSKGITKVFSIKIHPFIFNIFFNFSLKKIINSYENIQLCFTKDEQKFINNIIDSDFSISIIENYFLEKISANKINESLFEVYLNLKKSRANKNNRIVQKIRCKQT